MRHPMVDTEVPPTALEVEHLIVANAHGLALDLAEMPTSSTELASLVVGDRV